MKYLTKDDIKDICYNLRNYYEDYKDNLIKVENGKYDVVCKSMSFSSFVGTYNLTADFDWILNPYGFPEYFSKYNKDHAYSVIVFNFIDYLKYRKNADKIKRGYYRKPIAFN